MEAYAFRINELVNNCYWEHLLPIVSDHRRNLTSRYYNHNDKLRSLAGEILTRYAIIQELGYTNELIQFNYHHNQKPALNNHPCFHFNVSHSGDWVVCCTDVKPVGIDIEEMKDVDLTTLSNRVFSQKEQASILGMENYSSKKYFFYDRWTLKESILKNNGVGITYPLDKIHIQDDLTCHFQQKSYFLRTFTIDSTYKLALCTQKDFFSKDLLIISYQEAIQTLIY